MPNRPGRPRTYRERLNVYIDAALKDRLTAESVRSGDSEGEIVRRAIEAELSRQK